MSVKLRITLWFTLMVMILSILTLVFVLVVNGAAITDDPAERLVKTVMRNARRVEFDNGRFDWEDLHFFSRGISCTFYNGEGELLRGSVIDGLETDGFPLQSDMLRSFESGGEKYFLYDTYVDMDVAGFWIRGIVSSSDRSGLMHTIIILTCTLLPSLMILTLGGGWLIVSGSMRPLDKLINAADSISGGDDLSARTGIKRGPSEMRKLSQSFDRMFERLEASFNTQRQFASDASHELRTPISVILAQCDRSRRKDREPEDYKKSIAVIDGQARSMSELVQQLLSLTRMQHGTDKYPLKQADLSMFTEACISEFVPDNERGISLSTDIEPNIIVPFNPALMSRVVNNLLQNAYKYGRENGHVFLRLHREYGKAVLTVRDDGTGIEEKDLDKVFLRFWQADPSRSMDGSSGLGLAMVKEIAEFHSGTVSVESRPGEGSTFTFKI